MYDRRTPRSRNLKPTLWCWSRTCWKTLQRGNFSLRCVLLPREENKSHDEICPFGCRFELVCRRGKLWDTWWFHCNMFLPPTAPWQQEVFPVQYGIKFDTALQALTAGLVCKMEQLLPVPNLSQVCISETLWWNFFYPESDVTFWCWLQIIFFYYHYFFHRCTVAKIKPLN